MSKLMFLLPDSYSTLTAKSDSETHVTDPFFLLELHSIVELTLKLRFGVNS